jgi:methylated-DNA-[protein]-cysteine S-methyltransferase
MRPTAPHHPAADDSAAAAPAAAEADDAAATAAADEDDAAFVASLVGGPGDAERLKLLREHLDEHAERRGLLDVAYRTLESPVGSLLLAATPAGLLRVAYAAEDHEGVLSFLADRVSPRILYSASRLDPVARQLDEYFTGRRRAFELSLDMRLAVGFRREVLGCLTTIAYGETASYAHVATATGHARAVRAVGTACARNPLPIVVPCHRVVRSDGSLGQYLGGPLVKERLLALERS